MVISGGLYLATIQTGIIKLTIVNGWIIILYPETLSFHGKLITIPAKILSYDSNERL